MEVILLERVENLGLMGDVVNVKPGYARNYLLPKKKAISATATNKKQFENKNRGKDKHWPQDIKPQKRWLS